MAILILESYQIWTNLEKWFTPPDFWICWEKWKIFQEAQEAGFSWSTERRQNPPSLQAVASFVRLWHEKMTWWVRRGLMMMMMLRCPGKVLILRLRSLQWGVNHDQHETQWHTLGILAINSRSCYRRRDTRENTQGTHREHRPIVRLSPALFTLSSQHQQYSPLIGRDAGVASADWSRRGAPLSNEGGWSSWWAPAVDNIRSVQDCCSSTPVTSASA